MGKNFGQGVTTQRGVRLTGTSPVADKIAVFRDLFRGREDVYARRFESRQTKRAGYSPACGNEWVRGLCEKPKIKCSACAHPCWLGISDQVIHWHLAGRDDRGSGFVLGIYPMLLDETCFFLAVDFDGPGWRDDVAAFASVSKAGGLPIAIERSRSGDGAHAWFFFDAAVPAGVARKLGAHLLTEAMDLRPEIGLRSYDRLFPSQDTLPKGGFGNLIALPLQKEARRKGNSMFLDESLEPVSDQWEFLGKIKKLSLEQLCSVTAEAERKNRILGVRIAPDDDFALQPWKAPPSRLRKEHPHTGPLPESLPVEFSDQLYIEKSSIPPALRNRIIRLAAFQNPEFYRAQAMRLPTFDKPRIIGCAEDHPEHIAIPRGCLDDLTELLGTLGIAIEVRDHRTLGCPLDVMFRGELRPGQKPAAEAMLQHETGVLAATTAFGKTVIAAWLIARRQVNTLVLVHRQQLLEQWVARLAEYFQIPAESIGRLGGGRKKLHGALDVALIPSLVRKGVVDDRVAEYGHLVIDECHHLSARSFELVARRSKARFITGLSATVTRKDGQHPIIFMQCGPIRYRVDARAQAAARPFTHRVMVRPTGFRSTSEPEDDPRVAFQKFCDELVHDDMRNNRICDDVEASLVEGRTPLVLTERTEHVEILSLLLESRNLPVIRLQGGMGKKALRLAMGGLAGGDGRVVLVATGRFVGEGFDHSQLDTLFLAMPVSWRGTIAQYVGRLHRLHDGKTEARVYDYADLNIPMLERMFNRRCSGYEAVGYSILLPASAVPGWPPEAPLPVDPEWKRDYSTSVQRLIRDGLSSDLANLFVQASRRPGSDAVGVERARSASEAFLFRRLESLPGTAGLFSLNAILPIPFDQAGSMEVDFLCESARLVLELDGPQHLANEEAWRRDRKKDVLLQQNGYLVMRILASDAGRSLDAVLDAIQAALASRRR